MLHSGEAVLIAKLNCQSLTAIHTHSSNLLIVHANHACALAIYSSFHSYTYVDSHWHTYLSSYPHYTDVPRGFGTVVHLLPACRSTWFARQPPPRTSTMGPGASVVYVPAKLTHRTHVSKHACMPIPLQRVPLQTQTSPFVPRPCALSVLLMLAATAGCTSRSGYTTGSCCTDVLSCGVMRALHAFSPIPAPISSLVEFRTRGSIGGALAKWLKHSSKHNSPKWLISSGWFGKRLAINQIKHHLKCQIICELDK